MKMDYVAGNRLIIITKKEKERSTGCGICWRVSLKKLCAHPVIFLAKWLKFVCL